jgi:heme-degrading monooxygenase HmoA
MYMRITIGRIKPGKWDEFESAYKRHVEGIAASPGLRARWLVRSSTDSDIGFTISLWETLADMERYERSDAVKRQILPHMAPYLDGITTAHHCEVRGPGPLAPGPLTALFGPSERNP